MTTGTGKPPTIDNVLDEARGRIEVDDEELDEARDRRDKLRRVLEKEFPNSQTYVNGSIAHGDALTPLTDVDPFGGRSGSGCIEEPDPRPRRHHRELAMGWVDGVLSTAPLLVQKSGRRR